MPRPALVLGLVLLAGFARAAESLPTPAEVRALLPPPARKTVTVRLERVLAAPEGEGFVALGARVARRTAEEIGEDRALWPRYAGALPEADITPFAAHAARGADGRLALVGRLDLPVSAPAHRALAFGAAEVADLDGDGRPELHVAYGHESVYPGTSYGAAGYAEEAWVTLGAGAPALALHVLATRWIGSAKAIDLARTVAYRDGAAPPYRDIEVTTTSRGESATTTCRYDPAADRWTPLPR